MENSSSFSSDLKSIHQLIWSSSHGKDKVYLEIFKRWCQGFNFSSAEPTALLQEQGGPCAIHTAVQAAILRNILFEKKISFKDIDDGSDSIILLFEAIASILELVKLSKYDEDESPDVYYIAYVNPTTSSDFLFSSTPSTQLANDDKGISPSMQPQQQQINFNLFCDENVVNLDSFFRHISFCLLPGSASHEELCGILLSLCNSYQSPVGVLCLLYSVLLTHGLKSLQKDLAEEAFDRQFSLIHSNDGNSSQALLNLLLTGCATCQLFDDNRDLEGFTLMGIQCRPCTGFLTLMEALQYCQVGWNLKNPRYPIWVLGSESHWTLLFSNEMALIDDENIVDDKISPSQSLGSKNGKPASYNEALRSWHKMDPDGKGFLEADNRWDDFVDNIMNRKLTMDEHRELKSKLDPEDLGIIMESIFFSTLYPDEHQRRQLEEKKDFCLYHYNGLVRSNHQQTVRYRCGKAYIADPSKINCDSSQLYSGSPIHRCLRTKWSTLIVEWDADNSPPSLN